MDAVGAAAGIATIAVLLKDIVKTSNRYRKAYRDAPDLLKSLCHEAEALSVFFEHFERLNNASSVPLLSRLGVLNTVLFRTDLLNECRHRLQAVSVLINKHGALLRPGAKVRFTLDRKHIEDALGIVQHVHSILDTAVRHDDTSRIQTLEKHVLDLKDRQKQGFQQMITAHFGQGQQIQRQMVVVASDIKDAILSRMNELPLVDSDSDRQLQQRKDEHVNDIKDSMRATFVQKLASRRLHDQSLPLGASLQKIGVSPVRDGFSMGRLHRCLDVSPRFRLSRKQVYHFIFGCVIFRRGRTSSPSVDGEHAQASLLKVDFIPSRSFAQVIIKLQLAWSARIGAWSIPQASLQFLDVLSDDHVLFDICKFSDSASLKRLLDTRAISPMSCTIDGWTPLHYAASRGNLELCEVLLDQGVDPKATGLQGFTALHVAAHFGHFEIFKRLVSAGCDPDDYHQRGANAVRELLEALLNGKRDEVFSFLKWLFHGQQQYLIDVTLEDLGGDTILHHLTGCSALFPSIMHPFSQDLRACDEAPTDEDDAARFGDFARNNLIRLDSMPTENKRKGDYDLPGDCLHSDEEPTFAVPTGQRSTEACNLKGYTPLHQAVWFNNLSLATILISSGANMFSPCGWHILDGTCGAYVATPFILAASLDHKDMLELLSHHGAGKPLEEVRRAFRAALRTEAIHSIGWLFDTAGDK